MSRYALPGRCPDCTSLAPYDAEACPNCSLPLRGPLAHELWLTLTKADGELVALRALAVPPVLQPASTATAAPVPAVASGARATGPRRPVRVRSPRTSALSGASVPQLLLGLGALCLLVAALVFLAVTWSVMGVGGRTATLVGFTAVSAAITALVARRGLRGATESLGLVTLGLVGLDVAGADHAGWFGDLTEASFWVVLGASLAVSATVACLAVRRTPARSFTAGEVVIGLGWCLVALGISSSGYTTPAGRAVLTALLAAAGAAGAHRLRLPVAAPVVAAVAGLAWLALVGAGLDEVSTALTVAHVWADLAAWPLLVAALLLGVPALLLRVQPVVSGIAHSVAVSLVTFVVVCPALDNGATPATLAVLTTLAVALAVLVWLPEQWAAAAALTAAVTAAVAAVQSVLLVTEAGIRVGSAVSAGGPFSGRLPVGHLVGDLQPWLLLPDLGLTAVAFLVTCRILGSTVGLRSGIPVVGLVAVSATAALYPVPVWTLVVGLLLAGVVLLVAGRLPLAAPTLAAATVVATYSDGLTAIALGTVLASSVSVHLRDRREPVAEAAGFLVATTLAASVWTWGDLLDRPGEWTAVVALLVVAVLALVRPRPGMEGGAWVSIAAVTLSGLAVVPEDQLPTWAAVYLTLAGATACTQALLRADRRQLGWAGGALLAAASCVRLADLGVREPEPYTLPAALALLVFGVVQLRRSAEDSSVTALGPGLGLALVPSLLWVLDDPTTLRSLLLGLACLGLVLAGLRLRWTAPLVFGCAVGAAIVLRSAAPYIGDAVPRWATIGTVGVLLVALGITWEARVREARTVVGYVRGLR